MTKLFLSVALLALGIGTAQAADPPFLVEPPLVEIDEFDWTGFYVGVLGGGATGTGNFDFPFYPSGVDVPLTGGLAGAVLGGSVQMGRFVLGAEGEVAWANINGTTLCPNPLFNCAVSMNWLGDAEVQAGVAFDRLMLYVHGGFAAANTTSTTAPFLPGTATSVAIGYVAGAGLKVAVGERWSIVGEYSFYNLSTTTAAGTLDPLSAVNTNPVFHTFTIGANFHF